MVDVKKILIWILLALFVLQGLQFIYPVINVKKLKGVVYESNPPVFSANNWFNGKIQDYTNDYVDQKFGFRPDFIRIYNQLQYSLFNTIHNEGVVMGKDKFLFGTDYIKEYIGTDYLGDDSIQGQINKLHEIRDYLKKYNTELLVVLAPGKPYFYPEYLPEQFQNPTIKTNYYEFVKLLKDAGINTMDVNKWFIDMKDTSSAPLFTQTGVHWSVYGARLVADSLIRQSSQILQLPMNQIQIKNYVLSYDYQNSDNDLADLLNMFFDIHDYPAAYPLFEKDHTIPVDDRPSMVVIADSFFWLLFDGVLGDAYRSIDYYYYYSSIFSVNFEENTKVNNICVPCEFKEKDLVVIMTTTPSLKNFGFGFIDDFYVDIQPGSETRLDSLTRQYIDIIKADSNWMIVVQQKADEKNIDIDSMVLIDAKYMARKSLKDELNSH